jgi:hypothetical protein
MPIMFINGVECVECPCCKRRGYLVVCWPNEERQEICSHCMGEGTIPADRRPLRYFGEVPL